MKKLNNFIYKRHSLLVNEDDVKDVLYVVTRETHKTIPAIIMEKMSVGPWVEGSSDWFIHFTCNNEAWDRLVKKLNIEKTKNSNTSEKGKVYETVD